MVEQANARHSGAGIGVGLGFLSLSAIENLEPITEYHFIIPLSKMRIVSRARSSKRLGSVTLEANCILQVLRQISWQS